MSDSPLISCIMPTRNRRRFIPQALKYFQAQDYPNKELLIIDDTDYDWIGDLVPAQENIHYVRIDSTLDDPLSIGMKRNIACSLAKGDYIALWDDDDCYGPGRLSKQIAPLLSGEADFSAMRMSLFLDAEAGTLWTCSDDTHRQCFKQDVHYGTLLFPASFWKAGTYFPPESIGEDRRFTHALLAQNKRLARIVDPASYIYVVHGGNTTSDMRLVHPDGWEQVPIEQYLGEEERAFYGQFKGVLRDA